MISARLWKIGVVVVVVFVGRGPDYLVSVDKIFTLEVSLVLLRQ